MRIDWAADVHSSCGFREVLIISDRPSIASIMLSKARMDEALMFAGRI